MQTGKTRVGIVGDKFTVNDELTYKGRVWRGIPIEGLLLNSRMVQGIFDDKNPETASRWAYPDTGIWDSERNTEEFIKAMPLWAENGLNSFTINLQGGSPEGYSKEQPWQNTAFLPDGSMDEEYLERLDKIICKADKLGMVVILGYFYFGQDNRFNDEAAVLKATENATRWIIDKGYTNIIIEVANECDIVYTQQIILSGNIHKLINCVKSVERDGFRLLVGTSFSGGAIPTDNVIECSDFLLVHGNGVGDPERIEEMVKTLREEPSYKGQPVLFNEDDHFDFEKDTNNMVKALMNGASWGYFDPGVGNYEDGYQCPPVNWGINTQRKKDFFDLIKQVSGNR